MTTKALGLIETIGLAAAIEAADSAVKAANVKLLGYENTKGGGRITIKLVGDVGAVKAGVAAGAAAARRIGRVESCLVIPRPHQEIDALIGQIDRGPATTVTPAAPGPASAPLPAKAKPAQPKAPSSQAKPAPSRRPKDTAKDRPKPPAGGESVVFIAAPTPPEPPVEPPAGIEPEALQGAADEPRQDQ